jgi:ketosteroid isomerase-like protein
VSATRIADRALGMGRGRCQAARVGRPPYYGNPAGVTDDVEVVRAIYAAFARRDIDGVLEYLAPDCELHFEATASLSGRPEPYRGHDGMRQYFADVEQVWEELVLHAEDFRLIPGSVIVIGHVTGRRGGEPIRRASVWTWKVRHGKATMVRASDMGALSAD